MPEPVLLTVYTGARQLLELPVRPPRKEDAELKDFPPPAGAAPLAKTVISARQTLNG
jgi:hypothetical protein